MIRPLSEVLQNLKEPLVVKIVKGRLDFHGWRTFGEGQCVTLFPPSKQIMVLNPTSYENIDQDGKHTHADRVDNMSFICSQITESFKDKHCEGKIYHDISSILCDKPRYLRVQEGFFAFVEDENLCKMQKLEVGQVLELFEIHYDHSTENTELYENVRLKGGEILRCKCAEIGTDLMLPNSSKVDLVAMTDHNSYTLMDITDRFSFPRNISFSDTALSSSFKKIRSRAELFAASETAEEMLFACELGKTNIEFFDENLLQCSNVFMSPVSKIDVMDVWVEQCTGCVDSLETFRCLYAQKQTTLDNGQALYCVYGIEQTTNTNDDVKDDDENEDGGEDYEPMNRIEIPECPPVRQFLRSFENSPASSENSSRPASIHSVQSSRSSGSRSSAGEDYGGSYVHIHVDHYPIPRKENSPSFSDSSETKKASSPNTEINENTLDAGDVLSPNTQVEMKTPEMESVPSPNTQEMADNADKEATSSLGVQQIETRSTSEYDADDIQNKGVSELCEFLRIFKLNNLAEVCENEMVDGEFLSSLSDEELKNEPFFLKDFELRKFSKLKSGWRPKM